MGLIQHHAIVVTGCGGHVSTAHAYACGLDALVSPVSGPGVNGMQSFALWPDGSKEGWADSDAGNRARDSLVAFLVSLRYEDGSSPLRWVEVTFGECGAEVVRADTTEPARLPGAAISERYIKCSMDRECWLCTGEACARCGAGTFRSPFLTVTSAPTTSRSDTRRLLSMGN